MKKLLRSKRSWLSALLIITALLPFLIPEDKIIPVEGATKADWHKDTFWYEPWGSSGVHKGIDIFAAKGTPLRSTNHGIVVYSRTLAKGGEVIIVLGPKWRIHYYAHLEERAAHPFDLVKSGEIIGLTGDTGNAKNKPAHLHYSIVNLLPYPWKIDRSTQGWKKAFYLDPGKYLAP